jgi:replicative DNA helicase
MVSIGDRIPPQNIEAEESILGGILIEPDSLERIREILCVDAFSLDAHRIIYQAILEVKISGKKPDLLSVMSHLSDNGKLFRIGGQSKLVQLVDRTVSTINIDQYAKLVTDKYIRRKLIHDCNEAINQAYKNEPIGETILSLEQLINPLSLIKDVSLKEIEQAETELELKQLTKDIEEIEKIENPFDRKVAIKSLMKRSRWDIRSEKEFLDFHAKWLDCKNKVRSYSLDEYFDKHGGKSTQWILDSWLPQRGITVLFSKGGQGKTSLVGSLTKALIEGSNWSGYRVAKPINILWIQTDQGASVTTQLLDRQGFFALSPEVRIRQRILDQWQIEQFHILQEELKQHHFDLVVIDSLNSVSRGAIYSENDQEFARPLIRLREIGERFNTSFLILHHANHAGELRGTTAIFSAADQVWKLDRIRPKEGEDRAEDREFANLEIQKSRFRQDNRTYRVEFNTEDFSWFAIGEMLPSSDVAVPMTNPTQQRILHFFTQHEGVGYQAQELSELLNINGDYLRKCLNALLRDGLISSLRGTRRNKVYFCGQLHTTPPDTDPPENSQGLVVLGSFSDPSDPSDPPDPSDPSDPSDPEESRGSRGSRGSEGSETPETPIEHEDQKSDFRSSLEDQRGSEGSEPPEPRFKVGDRFTSKVTRRTGVVEKILVLDDQLHWNYLARFDDSDKTGVIIEGNFEVPTQLTIEDAVIATDEHAWKIEGFQKGDRVRRKDRTFFQDTHHQWPVGVIEDWHEICDRKSFDVKLPSNEVLRIDAEYIEIDTPINSVFPRYVFAARVKSANKIGTLIGKKSHSALVRWDSSSEASVCKFKDLFFVDAESDPSPFFRAFGLFDKLGKGDKIRALKHPDHNGNTNKVGTVVSKKYESGKFLVCCEENFMIFNLEAVKKIS